MKRTDARIMAVRGRSRVGGHSFEHNQQCGELGEDVSNALTSVEKDNYVVEFYE